MRGLILDVLGTLVSFDTRNPPREISTGGIFAFAREMLSAAGFDVQMHDLGDGCINLLAVRGTPSVLCNVHLDTVPADAHWQHDPFELQIEGDRAIGLGSCDIKGAAACVLAAATQTTGDAAILFTSDEEAGQSRCVHAAVADLPSCAGTVIVAEPTNCQAVLAHRGLCSCEGTFAGTASHGSLDAGETRSAVHHAAQWAHSALHHAERGGSDTYEGLHGWRLNIGVIEGGIKANIVASSARVVFGVRPLPMQSGAAILEQLCALAPRDASVTWNTRFMGPPLTPDDSTRAIVAQLGMQVSQAVDFWTEAALFAQAGLQSFVYGPGDIHQAHTSDEWISITQLERAAHMYQRIFTNKHGSTHGHIARHTYQPAQ